MIHDIFQRILEFVLLVGAGGLFAIIVAAGLYDIRAASRRPRNNAAIRHLKRTAQPSVTVIVYAQESVETIRGCLESLKQSRYANYDVVIVDNASQDGTQKAVRSYLRKRPLAAARLYAKKKRVSESEALRHAYKKSRKGDLVIILGAASRPQRSFIKSAVARFVIDPDLQWLTFNDRLNAPLAVHELASEVANSAGHIFKKAQSLFNARYGTIAVNGMYRKAVITDRLGGYSRFEGSLLLPVSEREWKPVEGRRKRAIWVTLTSAAILFMSYSMAAAALLVTYIPFLIGWLMVTIGSLAVIWSDEGVSMMQKVQLTLSATTIYFLAYVAMFKFTFKQMAKIISLDYDIFRPRRPWIKEQRAIS